MLRLLLLLSLLGLSSGIATAQTRRPGPAPQPVPGLPLPENPEAPNPGKPKPGGPKANPQSTPPQPEPEYIAGSGFVVGPRGWVMTSSIFVRGKNCPVATQDIQLPGQTPTSGSLSLPTLNRRVQPSVIQVFSRVGDCDITLKLPNGQLSLARVLRVDIRAGVALLASKTPLNLPSLPLACRASTSALVQPGEEIAVFGSSYGLPISMSNGVVNAVRSIQGYNFVQIDAPTNRGAVGGPILDRQGNVVGILTRDYRGEMRQNQGLAFGATLPQVFKSLNLSCGG